MQSRSIRPILAVIGLFAAGCADSHEAYIMADATTAKSAAPGVTPANSPRSSRENYAIAVPTPIAVTGGGFEENELKRDRVPIVDPVPGDLSKVQDKANADPTPRKILYTADIDVVVEDFSKLEKAILKLVKQSDGYLADTDVSGATGTNRTARWKIRIPVEKFDSFLDSASELGELTRRQVHSQDVSEEFYDLEARIKNKKVEETRLLRHLQDSTGKLDEILAAEKELSRVREEVERQEGRLRLLANLAALTTITITAQERTDYVPPTAPGFATRVSRTFEDSTKSLRESAEGFALWAVGIVPWLPVYLVVAVLLYLVYRVIRRRIVLQLNRPRPTAP